MPFDRREFLLAGAALAAASPARAATDISITLQPERKLHTIPADFMGLGYEISTIATPAVLSARNKTYVQLAKNLGRKGVIRVGGNTSDFSSFDAGGKPLSAPKGTIINTEGLRQLRTFLDAVDWKLIWGLNLGDDNLDNAVAEAKAVATTIGPRLLALEIGNEPDLFTRSGHRTGTNDYARWHGEYLRYKAAIRAVLPRVPFAGPDLAGATDWMGQYARDEGGDAVLLTAHHYITGQANPLATIDTMLAEDRRFQPSIATFQQVAAQANMPWRICETATYSGGGREGASDTFAAALWALDYLFVLASAGCSGVNMQTGVNHLGWISHYTPIGDDLAGHFSAAPEYYGLLAFAIAGRGTQIGVTTDVGGFDLTAYATQPGPHQTILTIVNKDPVHDAAVTVSGAPRGGRVTRLAGPSVDARDDVTLGGAAVDARGVWRGAKTEPVGTADGNASLQVAAGSAALIAFGT